MKKLLLIVCIFILASCADDKTFEDEKGKMFTVEPYGWANTEEKIEGVKYKTSVGNVVLSVIFSETVIVPILLTGWELFEPIDYKPKIDSINIKDTVNIIN